jgi:hypothetical protein
MLLLAAKRPLAGIALLLSLAVAGCGSTSSPSIPASGALVNATSKSPGQIILTRLGADRIGLQTSRAHAVPVPPPIVRTKVVAGVRHVITIPAPKPASTVTVPYSSVIYDPSGKTYLFTNVRPLTYVEVPITVDHISGSSVYLKTGPKPGARVVSVGAEELYGVQTGVLAQT